MEILHGEHQYETPGVSIRNVTWDDLVRLCETHRIIPRDPSAKWHAGWVCPAILHPYAPSRKLCDVAQVSNWIGLDIDHANWTLDDVLCRFRGTTCIIYSTTRSTATERRWRVLLLLSREMMPSEFSGVWRALDGLLDHEVDASTKNVNRLHYLPAEWLGGNNLYHVLSGEMVDVDQLLNVCPPEEPVYYTEVFEMDGVRAPEDEEIITPLMVERHMHAPPGGRFWKLMCAAATRYKVHGWLLTASELANAALAVSPRDSQGVKRAVSALREAERVLSFIDDRVETLTPLEQLRANMKWRLSL